MKAPIVLVPLFVVVPLAAAFVISLLGRRKPGLCNLLASSATLILFGLSLVAVRMVWTDPSLVYHVGGWSPPLGIAMVVDGLTAFMLVTVNMVVFAIVLYAREYMQQYTSTELFYALFMLTVAGMNGVVVAGDLFNLFVFFEVAAVASYALVAFGTERHALEAAFKYAMMGTLGSVFILLAIVLLYGLTSTLNMADMRMMLADHREHNLVLMVSVLLLAGFGLKAALVPFHAWLPDAHSSAPTPVSAMLSGVLIKSLGIYALFRIFYNVVGLSPRTASIFMVLGTVSMVVGVLLALGQRDLKRLLAYSSISQIGYVVLGLGLATPLGILGGLFHLFNHSVFKALLFLNSGALEYATGTRDLREMGGLARKMPVTGTTSFVASMSISGIPPFSGFWSKLIIILAAIQAGHIGYAVWAVIVSILTLAVFVKVMRAAFFGEPRPSSREVSEVPWLMQLPMMALATVCLLGGLLLLPAVRQAFLGQASAVLVEGVDVDPALGKAL